MGCGCKGRTAVKIEYEVKFVDGRPPKKFATKLEADNAARRAGGGTIRAKKKV